MGFEDETGFLNPFSEKAQVLFDIRKCRTDSKQSWTVLTLEAIASRWRPSLVEWRPSLVGLLAIASGVDGVSASLLVQRTGDSSDLLCTGGCLDLVRGSLTCNTEEACCAADDLGALRVALAHDPQWLFSHSTRNSSAEGLV